MISIIVPPDSPHINLSEQEIILKKITMSETYQQNFAIPAGQVRLKADLTIPPGAAAIIIFSQTGDPQNSHNRIMAQHLQKAGLGTLLPDLFTSEERKGYGKTFDLDLLTRRLVLVTAWLRDRDLFGHYRLSYYGTGLGAAAALTAAASLPNRIDAIVCRGGRLDLAKNVLARVDAATLLIVGELDRYVLRFNREALEQFISDSHLEIIPGTTHSFDEPGKMEAAARLTGTWFSQHAHPHIIANR
jgi:putative phosphoribosyl transferase